MFQFPTSLPFTMSFPDRSPFSSDLYTATVVTTTVCPSQRRGILETDCTRAIYTSFVQPDAGSGTTPGIIIDTSILEFPSATDPASSSARDYISSSTSSSSVLSSTTPATTVSSTQDNNVVANQSTSLSTRITAGIATGTIVAAISAILCLLYLILRRRRKAQAAQRQREMLSRKAEVSPSLRNILPAYGATNEVHEAPGTTYWELDGTSRAPHGMDEKVAEAGGHAAVHCDEDEDEYIVSPIEPSPGRATF